MLRRVRRGGAVGADALESRCRRAEATGQASLFLFVNLIGTYLPVRDEARERYRRLVSGEEYRKVQEVELTWADRLREEGREEGRQAGLVQGKRETLKRLLAAKFGPLPADVDAGVDSVTTTEELDRYLDHVLTARSLEELGL
jgi:hypothetical protein